jgi:hypothetical protein
LLLSRGLAALTLTILFSLSLHAEYLYKDDVVKNPQFSEQINAIGAELKAKTGVSLYLVMVRDTEENQSIADFEKQLAVELKEPAVIMTFIELKQKVDILARPVSLYEYFNKSQVLSPNATFIGSVVSAVMFARSFVAAELSVIGVEQFCRFWQNEPKVEIIPNIRWQCWTVTVMLLNKSLLNITLP